MDEAVRAQQQTILTKLVGEPYGLGDVTLSPIAHYWFEDRGIYQVVPAVGPSYVLRAFRSDVQAELLGQVAVLDCLAQCGYPAPRVQRIVPDEEEESCRILSWINSALPAASFSGR